ncbi:MAG: Cof-type HAD-IIB family hydrolase [Bifidobacteriaceae bacterium]|jgi:hydroxymethylpyrimidine pyrophosphatase-like HAD family hydrolase|nr:Cof-type HAD-IIB family hydrolase [Bifidobacteriaceae bacterium]
MAPEILLAVDIDGTLLTWDGELFASTERAIKRALAAPAIEFVLATGRSVHSTVGIARRIGVESGLAVCCNGSVTIRFDPRLPGGWELVHVVTFDPAPAIAAIRRRLPHARMAVEDLGRGFKVTAHFPAGELDGEVRVVSDQALSDGPVTRVILRDTELSLEELHAVVEETKLPDVTYAVGWTGWVDLNPPGVSKASALEAIRAELGIEPRRTVAIGDGGNDITMLQWAGRGVAMGGSRWDVVAAADEETGRIDQDGLASVIDSLL